MNPSMFEPLFDCGPFVSFQGHAQWYCASRVGGRTWRSLWGCKGWIGGKLVTTNYWYLQCRGTPVCVWIIQNQPNRKEKQDVTLPWWQNFWIPTILLDRDGHLHCWTMEEKYGLPFCSLVQSCTGKSYTFFFLLYLQYPDWLRSRNFATMATWCNDFSLLPYKRQGVVVTVSRKYWPEDGIFILGLARDCVVGEGGMGRWGERRRLSLPPSLESSPEIANSAFSPAKYKTIIYLRVWSSYQQIWRLTDTFSTCNLT